jgi:hypothetical protein
MEAKAGRPVVIWECQTEKLEKLARLQVKLERTLSAAKDRKAGRPIFTEGNGGNPASPRPGRAGNRSSLLDVRCSMFPALRQILSEK